MTDQELIQQRIDEIQGHLNEGRQTGKTYRAINNCIEELFNKPIGSQIHLIDNPPSKDVDELKEFASKFAKRMQRDFPDVNFKIQYPAPGIVIATRTTETYTETANKRIKQWKKKLEEMN